MSTTTAPIARAHARLADARVLWALVGVGAVAAIGVVLWATRNGAAVSPDSATYVAGARNLVAGRGYSDYQLVSITDWPPGFSITLAIAQEVGITALTAARWLNALALGVGVVLTFILARRYVQRPYLALTAALVAGFAPAMVGVFSFVWSEPIFCVITLGVLLLLERVGAAPCARFGPIIAVGLLAGIGFSYRYAGMTLVALVIVTVAVACWRSGTASMLRRTGGALVASMVVPVIVMGRNLTHGSLTGQRLPSTETVHGVVVSSERFLSGWILAGHHPATSLGDALIVGVILAMGIGIALRVRERGVGSVATRALFPLVAFVVGYALYIAITEFQTVIDPPDDRICCPVLAPAAIVVVVAIDAMLNHRWARRSPLVASGTFVLLAFWIAAMVHASTTAARADGGSGVRFEADGVTTPFWTGSPFIAGLRTLPGDISMFSNQPGGIYLATDRQPVFYSGQPLAVPPIPVPEQTIELKKTIARQHRPVYIVWSLPNYRPHLVDPNYLAAHGVRLQRVLTTPQGTIDKVIGLRP